MIENIFFAQKRGRLNFEPTSFGLYLLLYALVFVVILVVFAFAHSSREKLCRLVLVKREGTAFVLGVVIFTAVARTRALGIF